MLNNKSFKGIYCFDDLKKIKGVVNVIVQDEMWQDIPLIHVYDEKMDEHTPIVIFLHGFLSAKEHNLHYAYQLVRKGIRVILPDAVLHGDRATGEEEAKLNLQFWGIVMKSIQEVGIIYEELHTRGFISTNKIAIAGTSMGGIVSSGCLKQYEWIAAAAICMGAPAYNEFVDYQVEQFERSGKKLPLTKEQQEQIHTMIKQYDISTNLKAFNNRPVLFWHGRKDKTVPFNPTFNFYLNLRPYYEKTPDRLKFIVERNEGHKVNRTGVIAVTEWLAKHLSASELL